MSTVNFPVLNLKQAGGVAVNNTIVPGSSNAYDLGSSGLPFRDLYLSGNVGIGTTAPQEALHINGNITMSGANRYIGTTGTSNLSLRTNNTNRVTVDLNGNVGIGIANPVAPLEVQGNMLCYGTVSSGTGFMFRNKLINGDFRINQRGTSTNLASLTAVGATFGYVGDRWGVFRASYATGAVMAQGTNLGTSDLPYTDAGIKTFARVGRLSGNTGTGIMYCAYALESQDSYALAGKTVTLSFYYRTGANFSGTAITLNIMTGTGTDEGYQRGVSLTGSADVTKSFSTSTSWTYATFTTTLNANITQVAFDIRYTPVGTAGANDWFDITGVQLELGSVATPFEVRPYGVELGLCQRYFCKSFSTNVAPANNVGLDGDHQINLVAAGDPQIVIYWPVPMRAIPTVTLYNPYSSASPGQWSNGVTSSLAARPFGMTNIKTVIDNTDSSLAAGYWGIAWSSSAEL